MNLLIKAYSCIKVRRLTTKKLIVIFLILFGTRLSFGAAFCAELLQNSGGASVELEMRVSKPVLDILTTSDGTVGGLIQNAKLPRHYTEWAEKNYPQSDPKLIDWDLLNDDMKMNLLRFVSKNKKTNFFDDRNVPNVKVKSTIHVKFDEDTFFLGQKYLAGEHDVDVSKFFGRVEYMGPDSVKNFSGVELHLRSSEIKAGDLMESAWNFQQGIRARKTHLHEHIVSPIPIAELNKNRTQTSLVLAEYFRRANLLAEFVSVLRLHGLFANNRFSLSNLATISYFDSITPSFISGIFDYFNSGFDKKIGSDFKMGWVGFRGSDVYDQPHVYGFEYRAISASDNLVLHKKILSNMQSGMRTQRYGFSADTISNWIASKGIDSNDITQIETILESTWYKQSYTKLFRKLPNYLKPAVGGPVKSLFRVARLKLNSMGNQAIKMLLYDWASDPLFLGDKEAREKLMLEQTEALNRYFLDGESLNIVVSDFVWDSGLLDKVAQTFNLEKSDFNELLKDDVD